MKKLLTIVAVLIWLTATQTFAIDYSSYTMPENSNRASHTFQYWQWLWDSKFTVYYDNSQTVAWHVHFFNVPITEYHTIENISTTSESICRVNRIEFMQATSEAWNFCGSQVSNTCKSIDAKIIELEKMIVSLRNSKYMDVVTDKNVDIKKIPTSRVVEVAVYVPVEYRYNTQYITQEKEKIVYRLPATGADISLLK